MLSKKKMQSMKIDTLIGSGARMEGDIYFSGVLHIDSEVRGNIVSECKDKSLLIIAEKGVIKGNVIGSMVIINGTVEGNIYVSGTLELARHAKVQGNIHYNMLELEVGAQVNGSLYYKTAEQLSDVTVYADSGISLSNMQSGTSQQAD